MRDGGDERFIGLPPPNMPFEGAGHGIVGDRELFCIGMELQGLGVVVVEADFKHHPQPLALSVGFERARVQERRKVFDGKKRAEHGECLLQSEIFRRQLRPFGRFMLFYEGDEGLTMLHVSATLFIN